MTNNNGDYVTIKIPKELADQIDQIIWSGNLGYRSRAELVTESVRRRIEHLRSNDTMNNNNAKSSKEQ